MTERLYYEDTFLREFEATVVAVEHEADRRVIVLDRTAFYPTSGGQPFDTGTLDDARVIDVLDRDDGTIAHIVSSPLETARTVTGRIDWPRRFEHMQQHTGQHVLSAVFDRLYGARTESFHLGAAASTVDLAREVSETDIRAAESEANRLVWEDRLVSIRYAEAGEAGQLPLRKESARTGRLRLIDIDGVDLSACGGTHVARTGAIGVVAISSWEKFRKGTRVEFVCGGRALRAFRELHAAVSGSIRVLSVVPAELPAAVERVQQDGRELRRTLQAMQVRLAGFEASGLARTAEPLGATRVVLRALDGCDAAGLKTIAGAVASEPGFVAVLLTGTPPLSIAIARAAGVPLDAGALLKTLAARFGGRGGGRPELAQGGGLQAHADDVLAAARAALVETLGG